MNGWVWRAFGLGLGLGLLMRAQNPATAAAPSAARAATPQAGAASRGLPSSLWHIVQSVGIRIGNDRVLAEAASVTYYSLLAIFPALAALISLYGLVADPSTIARTMDGLGGIVPEGGMQILDDQIHSLTAAPHKALGLGAITGLLISIWSATAGIKSLFDALNAVYECRETRSFLHRTWLSLAFTLGALAFVGLAVGAVVVVPVVLNYVGFASVTGTLLALLRWPMLLLAFALLLAVLYRYGPSRRGAKWRWISWGSFCASLAWVAGSAGFSWYVANFGSYNKTYGSLGAAVGFMTWIWISTIIVLTGAELNAELDRETSGAPVVAG